MATVLLVIHLAMGVFGAAAFPGPVPPYPPSPASLPQDARGPEWISHDRLPPQDDLMPPQEAQGSDLTSHDRRLPQSDCRLLSALDQMLQAEADDIESSLNRDSADIDKVVRVEWLPLLGSASQHHSYLAQECPESVSLRGSEVGTASKEVTRIDMYKAHPGRVFPNYCALCNLSFKAGMNFAPIFQCISEIILQSLSPCSRDTIRPTQM
jgi:hypothetical protein